MNLQTKFLRFWICAFIICISHYARASDKNRVNCRITIDLLLKTGEKKHEQIDTFEKSEAACKKSVKLYEINFAPQSVVKKQVQALWLSSNVRKTREVKK